MDKNIKEALCQAHIFQIIFHNLDDRVSFASINSLCNEIANKIVCNRQLQIADSELYLIDNATEFARSQCEKSYQSENIYEHYYTTLTVFCKPTTEQLSSADILLNIKQIQKVLNK
uniref:Late expression factor 11 n=1 Tax=Rhabditophanes sp. KR3021 TaxID=114890 RepID=A0AC35TZ64_9BILA